MIYKKNTAFDEKNQQKSYLEFTMEAISKLSDRVSVIPVGADKKALVPWREYQNRRATLAEIQAWWRCYPDANVAIVTGEISDVVVVDCDNEPARKRLEPLLAGASPWEAKTPRGYHLYFKYRPGLVNKSAVLPGVDVRTTGGYAIAPPSVNADGLAYEWIKGGDSSVSEPGAMPEALFNLLTPKEKPKREAPPNDGPGPDNAYGRAALADECRKVTEAPETTRNNTLNKAALKLGHYVGGGILSYAEVENALLNAALACGLPERDARATIKSGLDAGIQEPRTPPNNDKHSSHGGERTEPPKADEWEAPIPLGMPRPAPMPENILEGPVGEMVKAVSLFTETPYELGAGLSLVSVGCPVAGKMEVQVKPGYCEPLNFMVAPALETGNRKSSVVEKIFGPHIRWEAEKYRELEPEIKRVAAKNNAIESRIKKLNGDYAKAKGPDEKAAILDSITEATDEKEPEPVPPKVFCDDITPEHLGTVMALYDGRMALVSDEGGYLISWPVATPRAAMRTWICS